MSVLDRFTSRKGAGARKTVTFGDASEVKGSPAWSVASLLFVVLVWWWIKRGSEPMVNDRTFPSMGQTLDALIELVDRGYRRVGLWDHTWASLWRVLKGLVYGVVVGVPVGSRATPRSASRSRYS